MISDVLEEYQYGQTSQEQRIVANASVPSRPDRTSRDWLYSTEEVPGLIILGAWKASHIPTSGFRPLQGIWQNAGKY
jgi:hypothetical protein